MKNLSRVSEIKLIYKNKVKSPERIKIIDAKSASKLVYEFWDKDTIEHIEEVKLLLLNRSNQVLGLVTISKGGTTGSLIDIKIVLQYALKTNSSGIIIIHNHPSGNSKPSKADINITSKLKKACELLDISFLDHLIITPGGEFISLNESQTLTNI